MRVQIRGDEEGTVSRMSDHITENAGYDDSSELHPTVGFDYDAVSKALGEDPDFLAEMAEFTDEEMERAFKCTQALMAWIHQNGSTNLNGIAIRSLIVCWITLPHLRPLSLTELSRGYGLKKQSVGRWVEDKPLGFKAKFPSVKTSHMSFE
jgi:hypothetical protein